MQWLLDLVLVGLLAATLFHFGELAIPDLKEALRARGIPIRPWT